MKLSLKALRVNAGLTAKELAEKCGVTQATIVNWEAHPERVRFGTILKLCEIYGVLPEEIKV